LRRLYLKCSQNWSEISSSFVQHQAVTIFKNSKYNFSSSLIIFLLNYCRKAIPNEILTGLFPFSDFFTFSCQKRPFLGEECRGQTLSKSQNIFMRNKLHNIFVPRSNNTSVVIVVSVEMFGSQHLRWWRAWEPNLPETQNLRTLHVLLAIFSGRCLWKNHCIWVMKSQ
jgi:hypothetical protein